MPKPNHVSIRDVVNLSRDRIASAVDALLARTPEPLSEEEAEDIFAETSLILMRAQESLTAAEAEPFTACIRLLNFAFDVLPEVGIDTFTSNVMLIHNLHTLFEAVVVRHELIDPALEDYAALDALLHVVEPLCDPITTKEMIGEATMAPLAALMEVEHFPYNVHRLAARCLIRLIVQCKANKDRLKPWSFLGPAFMKTHDVYFQVQLVELMFRLGVRQPSFFGSLGLPDRVTEALRALPNDKNLMDKIVDLVDDAMDASEPRMIVRFDAAKVEAGGETLCEPSKVYFAPTYFVVLPHALADPVTIPYTGIRSVRVSKDSRITCKLHDVPMYLEGIIKIDPEEAGAKGNGNTKGGTDCVVLHLSPGDAIEFKKTAIQGWIKESIDRQRQLKQKREAEAALKSAQIMVKLKQMEAAANSRQSGTPAGKTPVSAAMPPPESVTPAMAAPSGVTPARKNSASNAKSKTPSAKKSMSAQKMMSAQKASPMDDSGDDEPFAAGGSTQPPSQHGFEVEDDSPAEVTRNSGSAMKARHERTSSPGSLDRKKKRSEGIANTPSARRPPPASASPAAALKLDVRPSGSRARLEGNAAPQAAAPPAAPAAVPDIDPSVDQLVENLKLVITQQVAKKRQEAMQVLRNELTSVQTMVDESREEVAARLLDFQTAVDNQITSTNDRFVEWRDAAREQVESLKGNLQDTRAATQALDDQINLLDIETQKILDSAKMAEDEHLRGIKRRVDNDMKELEHRLNAAPMPSIPQFGNTSMGATASMLGGVAGGQQAPSLASRLVSGVVASRVQSRAASRGGPFTSLELNF